mmetsp:Transcript_43768/g.93066  ORF Transcript_43768/g.93066 Transcript_43768/m.93066 type:complete len:97 (-) Transcript_43768:716-1006(-)|eukprot:CAMPEP_0172566452 /NCGR_PEP_ID=MMETSP1067-20121228/111906_1 /TAXON_ID=265564 ORGANISM="Thalassiosira punctigera, Strain Tpunct2005C2" /NCGR_SAMPLE_ID=MMETSP1067 /ASSEMBLY_ACC=CAM_ASM_000444 /LENGTH=96 /DNA_ID=CAMNT_0013357571 /DNA_START=663 /DNA_END=953 /DNA_ORIENTATION=+
MGEVNRRSDLKEVSLESRYTTSSQGRITLEVNIGLKQVHLDLEDNNLKERITLTLKKATSTRATNEDDLISERTTSSLRRATLRRSAISRRRVTST